MRLKQSTAGKRESLKLSLVNDAITMQGVAFTSTAVMFTKELTIEQLNGLAAKVMEMHGGVSWWLGDIGLALQEKKGEHYTSERAEIMGVDPGYWKNCVSVARFFKPSHRNDGLSFKHHLEAMRAAGGATTGTVTKARTWITQAVENKWRASDLRKHVNLSLATARRPEAPPEQNQFGPLDDADAWLTKKPALPTVNPEQARALVTRWASLIAFVKQLQEIAALP